jgi:hypothetical protein
MDEQETESRQSLPLRALDYEPPPRPRKRDFSILLGAGAGFFISLGVGVATFGVMMAVGKVRDEFAGAVGFGFASMSFGLSLAGLFWLVRYKDRS